MKVLVYALTVSLFIFSGCASKDKESTDKDRRLKAGAGIGAATGAVVGGIIGKNSGNAARGAVIGGILGGTAGGFAGHRMDKQAQELEKIAETRRTEQGLITKLKSDILFDTGKATLKPEAKENLQQMADIMKKYPENVLTVNGYTDNTGSSKINEELSERRAEVVKQTLVAYGIPESTIAAEGLGAARPVAENTTIEGRQKNRRVEIDVRIDESKVPKQ